MVFPKKHRVRVATYPFIQEAEEAQARSARQAQGRLGRRVLSGAAALLLVSTCVPFGVQAASADTLVIESLQDMPVPGPWDRELVEGAAPEDAVALEPSDEGLDAMDIVVPVPASGTEGSQWNAHGSTGPKAPTFRDVARGMYYTDAIDYVTALGLMEGTSKATFSPDFEVTRADVVELLYRLEGSPLALEPEFLDVSAASPHAAAIAWAASEGIVIGYGGGDLFFPEVGVSRQELATILLRYAQAKGLDNGLRADLTMFPDDPYVEPWAREAFAWAKANGVIAGVAKAWLQPFGTMTRAQLAVIAERFGTNVLGMEVADAAQDDAFAIDTETAPKGYVLATGISTSKLKLRVTRGQESYDYDMPRDGTPVVVPLNMGNGRYRLRILQNSSAAKYVEVFGMMLDVTLERPEAVFPLPGQGSPAN